MKKLLLFAVLSSFASIGYAAGPMTPEMATLAPTNITETTATFNGTVVTVGDSNFVSVIYWGDTDGITNKEAWQYAALDISDVVDGSSIAYDVAGLISGRAYYYRLYGSNAYGESWAPTGTNFVTLSDYSLQTSTNIPNGSLLFAGADNPVGMSFANGGATPSNYISLVGENVDLYYRMMPVNVFDPTNMNFNLETNVVFSWESLANHRFQFHEGSNITEMTTSVVTTTATTLTNNYAFGVLFYWRVDAQNLYSGSIYPGSVYSNRVRNALVPGTPNIYSPASPYSMAYNAYLTMYWTPCDNTIRYDEYGVSTGTSAAEPALVDYVWLGWTYPPTTYIYTLYNGNTSGSTVYHWRKVVAVGVEGGFATTSNVIRIDAASRPPLPTGASGLSPTTFQSGVATGCSFNPGSYANTWDLDNWTGSAWVRQLSNQSPSDPSFTTTWTGSGGYKMRIIMRNNYASVTTTWNIWVNN